MTTTIRPRPPYMRLSAPKQYSADWLNREHGNIQRAMLSTASRMVVGTTTDTPTPTDDVVYYDASGGAITVTLLPPDQVHDWQVTLKKIDASANAVTLVGTIDGVVNPTLATQYKSITIHSNGSTYYKLASV